MSIKQVHRGVPQPLSPALQTALLAIESGKPEVADRIMHEHEQNVAKRAAKRLGGAPVPSGPPVAPVGAPMPSMTAPAPAAPTTPPPTGEPDPRIAAIAKILGCDPNDVEGIRAAFESLFCPFEVQTAEALRQLTASERYECKRAGASPVRFLQLKAQRAGRAKGVR